MLIFPHLECSKCLFSALLSPAGHFLQALPLHLSSAHHWDDTSSRFPRSRWVMNVDKLCAFKNILTICPGDLTPPQGMAKWPLCTAAGSQALGGEPGWINRMASAMLPLNTTGVVKDQESIEHRAICVFVNITCVSALLGISSRKLHLFQNINRARGKKGLLHIKVGEKRTRQDGCVMHSCTLTLSPSRLSSIHPLQSVLDVFSAIAYDTSNLETDFVSNFSYARKSKSGTFKLK